MNLPHYLARALCALFTLPIVAGLSSCEKPAAATSSGPPEVRVTEVIQKDVPDVQEWVGTLNGFENAEVRARVTGYLESLNYQEGGYVRKGDLLFQIDPRPFVAALDGAKGKLEQAKAAMLGKELDAKRAADLYERHVISEQEYTDKTQDYRTDLAAVTAAQAAVEEAQLDLDYTKITSPLDGIAGRAQANIGDLVGTASNSVLTTVSQLDPIRCYFPISEEHYWDYAAEFQKMMAVPEQERPDRVELILPNGSVYAHKGKFAFVDRNVDPQTGTIQIAVDFPNPDLTLRPGQFVTARAQVKTIPNALLVPQEAVSQLQGGDQLAIVNPDGKAEIRAVKTGMVWGKLIVITDGVKAGEKVVVVGFQKVRQGMQVSAKPNSGPATNQGEQSVSKTDSSPGQS
jgi:membrane fusion protein, multidrug efflux system